MPLPLPDAGGGKAFHAKLSTRKQVQQHGDANRDLLWDDTEGELCTCCKAEDLLFFLQSLCSGLQSFFGYYALPKGKKLCWSSFA